MFITKLQVEEVDDVNWRLLSDLIFKSKDVEYRVPVEFQTDFASVPRATAWLYPRTGLYSKSAVLHDWLITCMLPTGYIDSVHVDRMFREAMKASGVTFPRRWIMWAGVRLGALGNPKRRAGSLRTFPLLLFVLLAASPVVLVPSLVVQIMLTLLWLVSLVLPNRQKVDAQKT
jgi:uncharacterized protein DUF1353